LKKNVLFLQRWGRESLQGDDFTQHFVTACRRYPAMGQLEIYLLLN